MTDTSHNWQHFLHSRKIDASVYNRKNRDGLNFQCLEASCSIDIHQYLKQYWPKKTLLGVDSHGEQGEILKKVDWEIDAILAADHICINSEGNSSNQVHIHQIDVTHDYAPFASYVDQGVFVLAHLLEFWSDHSVDHSVVCPLVKISVGHDYISTISFLRALRYLTQSLTDQTSWVKPSYWVQQGIDDATIFDFDMNSLRSCGTAYVALLSGADFCELLPKQALHHKVSPGYLSDSDHLQQLRSAHMIHRLFTHESKLQDHPDPVGGSFSFEQMTHKYVNEIFDKFSEVFQNSETSSFVSQVFPQKSHAAYQAAQERIHSGKSKVCGVNIYHNKLESSELDRFSKRDHSFHFPTATMTFEQVRLQALKNISNAPIMYYYIDGEEKDFIKSLNVFFDMCSLMSCHFEKCYSLKFEPAGNTLSSLFIFAQTDRLLIILNQLLDKSKCGWNKVYVPLVADEVMSKAQNHYGQLLEVFDHQQLTLGFMKSLWGTELMGGQQ